MKNSTFKALAIVACASFVALGTKQFSSVIAEAINNITYKNYDSHKTTSDESFDFEGEQSKSLINFDGKKDALYGNTPCLTYGGASGKSVNLFTYHDNANLFFLFEVNDTNVLTQATGSSSAYNEDGVEIYIDPLADGGTSPRSDDIQLNLGLSGYSRRLVGTGTGWKAGNIYMDYKSSLMSNTTLNDETDTDKGYYLEAKIPYSILGTTKNSPVCLTFAHADLSHRGDSRKWYGLAGRSDQYKVSATTNPDAYLVLTKENKLYSKANYAKSLYSNPTVFGKIVDNTGSPVVGATVNGFSVNGDSDYVVTTGNNGCFYFDNVPVNSDFQVEISKDGFFPFKYIIESGKLKKSMSSVCSKDIRLYPTYLAGSKVDVTGKITCLADSLKDFEVSIEGDTTSYKTNANGEFTAKVYKNTVNTLLISKKGYETKRITVSSENAVANKDLGTFEIYNIFTCLGEPSSSGNMNSLSGYVTKTLNGFVFKGESKYAIEDEEELEIYVNTGDSGFNKAYSDGDYKVTYSNKTPKVFAYNSTSKQWVEDSNLSNQITVSEEIDVLYDTYLTIPASAYEKQNSDTVGLAYKYFNSEAYELTNTSDSPDNTINADSTALYARFDKDGKCFFALNNDANPNEEVMYINSIAGASNEAIPENGDHFFITYTKNSTGVKISFVVDDGFGTHINPAYSLTGLEALNMIIGIDDNAMTAWKMNVNSNCYDINLRLYSDGTACYTRANDFTVNSANQLWWSHRPHNNGVAQNLTLDAHDVNSSKYSCEAFNGGKKYTFSFTYQDLLEMGGAPSSATLNSSKNITFGAWECSETSKTTIRFYSTGEKSRFILKDNIVTCLDTPLSSQANHQLFILK